MQQDVICKLLAIAGIAAAIGFFSVEHGQPDSTPVPQSQAAYIVQARSAGPATGALDAVGGDVSSDDDGRADGYLWSDALPATVVANARMDLE